MPSHINTDPSMYDDRLQGDIRTTSHDDGHVTPTRLVNINDLSMYHVRHSPHLVSTPKVVSHICVVDPNITHGHHVFLPREVVPACPNF